MGATLLENAGVAPTLGRARLMGRAAKLISVVLPPGRRGRQGPVEAAGAAHEPPPLALELTHSTVRFRSVDEFEFALASRTDFPVHRFAEVLRAPLDSLRESIDGIRASERRFAELLAHSAQAPGLLAEFLFSLERRLFSRDHEWRDIMDSLIRQPPQYDAYKRVAVAKYMQYLRARLELTVTIYAERIAYDEHDAESTRDTAHAATSAACLDARREREMALLPKGEPVCVSLEAGSEVPLFLAGNPFRLGVERGFYLIDHGGARYPLGGGANLVGRHSSSQVVIDPACRTISRRHLVLEPLAEDRIQLTDLSAHGTEVPRDLL